MDSVFPAQNRRAGGLAATPDLPEAPDTAALQAEVRRLRAENATLVRLNRLQGRFVAMASHEFKTPLTSITAYTDAMLAHGDDPAFDRGPQFLAVVREEAARLLRMVNRILDFSRMEYGSRLLDRRPTDLAGLTATTLRTLEASAAAKRQRLTLTAAADLPPAEVDADLVRQVIVNLVGNAIKYTPAGGRIEVTVAEAAAFVSVEVADDGPGVPADELRRIFREFYRAEGAAAGETGTGLGLSIVQHIVSLHGGHVSVRRRERAGTAFAFAVPKEVTTPADDSTHPAGHPGVLRALVRLLVEHADSRAAVLLLPAAGGALQPAAWTGLPTTLRLPELVPLPPGSGQGLPEALGLGGSGNPAWLAAPLGDGSRGWLILGRRCAAGGYGARDRAQIEVLGRIGAQALKGGAEDPGRTVEALRLLLHIRRRGIPTATPEALELAAALAAGLGLGPTEARRLQDAAALHDAGMARVDDEILHGEGDLDWDARDEIDRHVQLGLDLLAPLLADAATADLIRHHHERFDGGGHPDGLAGSAIPLGARALAVLDAWCSLTRERPYRSGLGPRAALAEIERCVGSQFDPAVVAAFAAVVAAGGTQPEPSGAGSGTAPGA